MSEKKINFQKIYNLCYNKLSLIEISLINFELINIVYKKCL